MSTVILIVVAFVYIALTVLFFCTMSTSGLKKMFIDLKDQIDTINNSIETGVLRIWNGPSRPFGEPGPGCKILHETAKLEHWLYDGEIRSWSVAEHVNSCSKYQDIYFNSKRWINPSELVEAGIVEHKILCRHTRTVVERPLGGTRIIFCTDCGTELLPPKGAGAGSGIPRPPERPAPLPDPYIPGT